MVVLQSSLFATYPKRLVAPLRLATAFVEAAFPALAPRFTIDAQRVVLDIFQVQAVPRAALRRVIASLDDDDSAARIVNALDVLLSRAYG